MYRFVLYRGYAIVLFCSTSCLVLAEELGPVPAWFGSSTEEPQILFSSSVPPVDTQDRDAVVSFYTSEYLPSEDVPIEWNGDVLNCVSGTNSFAFAEATIRRVNFFRAMAGLPGTVALDPVWSDKCQDAALMMSARGALSHYPDPGWKCYTYDGDEAAGKANLYHGRSGASAVDGYMDDWGDINYFVGHRRWILYPPQVLMGTGSVPNIDGRLGANVLWVIGGFGTRPPGVPWVAWPPPGYVPYQLLPKVSKRWSFSRPGADFSNANVSVWFSGTNVSLSVEPLENTSGYADNTIVWVPQSVPTTAPLQDMVYHVSIEQVIVSGTTQSFGYSVTIIDPSAAPSALPAITQEPADQKVLPGASATFQLAASGKEPLIFLWFHNGSNAIAGATNTTHTVEGVHGGSIGGYSVVVTNSVGSATSRVASLTIDVPPPYLTMPFPGVMAWTGVSNLNYTIQSSTNVAELDAWTTLHTISSTTTGFQFTNATPELQKFYRVFTP